MLRHRGKKTGDIITFAQFDEGNILTKTRNDAESGNESDNKSIVTSEKDIENLESNEKSDHDLISMEMVEDICDGSQTHPKINKREARYKIRDHIRQRKPQWKRALKAMQSTEKG